MDRVVWLETTLGAVLTVLVMAFVGRRHSSMPLVDQGLLHFRLPKVFVIMAGVSMLMAIFLAIGSYLLITTQWPVALFLEAIAVVSGYMGVCCYSLTEGITKWPATPIRCLSSTAGNELKRVSGRTWSPPGYTR